MGRSPSGKLKIIKLFKHGRIVVQCWHRTCHQVAGLALTVGRYLPPYATVWFGEGARSRERLRGRILRATSRKENPDDTGLIRAEADLAYKMGDMERYGELMQEVIASDPNNPELYYNLGVGTAQRGETDKAMEYYKKALELKPDFAEVYNNIGVAYNELGMNENAVTSYKKAIEFNNQYVSAYFNLGNAYRVANDFDASCEKYIESIQLDPKNKGIWDSLFYTFVTLPLSGSTKVDAFHDKVREIGKNNINYDILQFRIASFQPHLTDGSFSHITKQLSANSTDEIANPQTPDQSNTSPSVPDKMIALLHFGRSGTGLLHSLIDNHAEVSTLPSIYFSEYFYADSWRKLTANGWDQIPDNFVRQYEVLFDASSTSPVLSVAELIHDIGKDEGMANVGENRDEVLTVDRDIFCDELRSLMNCYAKLDPSTFFTLVHVAYEAALNNPSDKHTILYHIHNPSVYTKLNFLRYRPDTRFVMMVREPVQSCESWIRGCFIKKEYGDDVVPQRILVMLFDIDQIAFRKCDSVGVRLEDLKLYPEETISSLCDWMGIEEEPGLYEMTAQGKKWWGDPSSVDYSEEGMSPFDDSSIKREIGSIFSDRDQFVLRTFFYPFSVRFGYVEEDLSGFRRDLLEVKPMLDDMFDFEKRIASDSNIDLDVYKKSVSYLYLRAGLLDRWKVLNEFSDYPHMLTPLKIELTT